MDATPIDLGDAHPLGDSAGGSLSPPLDPGLISPLALKWAALHDAAATIATVAGMAPLLVSPEVRIFPVAIGSASGWRLNLAEQQIDDLTAIMETGVSALIAAFRRGAAPLNAARALAEEFEHARDAVLTLLPPDAPVRSSS